MSFSAPSYHSQYRTSGDFPDDFKEGTKIRYRLPSLQQSFKSASVESLSDDVSHRFKLDLSPRQLPQIHADRHVSFKNETVDSGFYSEASKDKIQHTVEALQFFTCSICASTYVYKPKNGFDELFELMRQVLPNLKSLVDSHDMTDTDISQQLGMLDSINVNKQLSVFADSTYMTLEPETTNNKKCARCNEPVTESADETKQQHHPQAVLFTNAKGVLFERTNNPHCTCAKSAGGLSMPPAVSGLYVVAGCDNCVGAGGLGTGPVAGTQTVGTSRRLELPEEERLAVYRSVLYMMTIVGQSPVPYTHFINQLRILKRRRGPQSASSFKVYQKERMARVEKARALLEKHQMMMGRQNAAFDRAHTERMAREREAERIAVTKSAMEAAELATKAAQQAMKDEEAEARRRAARNVHFTQKPGSGSPTTRTPPLPVAPPHKKTEHIAKRPRSPRDRRDSGESTDSGRLRREKEKMPVLPISQDLGISGEEPSDIIDVNDDNDNDVNDDVIDDVLDDNISVSILLIESEEDESCSVVDLQDIAPDSSTHIEPVPPDHTNSEKSIPAPRPDSPPAKAPAKSNDKPHAAKPKVKTKKKKKSKEEMMQRKTSTVEHHKKGRRKTHGTGEHDDDAEKLGEGKDSHSSTLDLPKPGGSSESLGTDKSATSGSFTDVEKRQRWRAQPVKPTIKSPSPPPELEPQRPVFVSKTTGDLVYSDSDDDELNKKKSEGDDMPVMAMMTTVMDLPQLPDVSMCRTLSTSRERKKPPAASKSMPNWNMKRRGARILDKSLSGDMERERMAEERRARAAAMLERLKKRHVSSEDEDDDAHDSAPRYEDHGWLAQFCILDDLTVSMYRRAWDAVDFYQRGRLDPMSMMIGLRGINHGLTEHQEEYVYRVLELTGYSVREGGDFKLFAVVAALSQKIARVDKWMKNLINRLDFRMLDMKLFWCKRLWEVNCDPVLKKMPLENVWVELKAGGVSPEHEQEAREKLGPLGALDLFDFLTYVPLFIMCHESVVENPLDDSRTK